MTQRLERDGLVRRVVDADDARARLVELTAKGERTRSRIVRSFEGMGARAAGSRIRTYR